MTSLLLMSFFEFSLLLVCLTFSDDLENLPVTPSVAVSSGSRSWLRSLPFLDLWDHDDEEEDESDDDTDEDPDTLMRMRDT